MKLALSTAVLALAVMNGTAAADTSNASNTLPKFGSNLLVDTTGMTLYTFDNDAAGKSNCNGGCAAAWPPAAVAPDIERARGEITIITREDGALQWAYKGMPLYRFAGDARPGDMNGDNQGNAWHAVRSGSAEQRAPAAAPMGYRSY